MSLKIKKEEKGRENGKESSIIKINKPKTQLFFLFFFFNEWGIQNRHIVPFLESVSIRKRKKVMTNIKIKQIAKISKRGHSNIYAI